jgi:hypothetical protein
MPRVDEFDEARAVDMGVDLGGRDVRMAKKRLQDAKIGTT